MFKCQICSQSADRPTKVVIERKMVDHLKGVSQGPRGGQGSQIVHELSLCPACVSATPEAPIERAVAVVAEVKKLPVTIADAVA